MITIPALPINDIVSQIASVLGALWPLLALIAGVAVGVWAFRRVISVFGRVR